jgi:hypothetical protein
MTLRDKFSCIRGKHNWMNVSLFPHIAQRKCRLCKRVERMNAKGKWAKWCR